MFGWRQIFFITLGWLYKSCESIFLTRSYFIQFSGNWTDPTLKLIPLRNKYFGITEVGKTEVSNTEDKVGSSMEVGKTEVDNTEGGKKSMWRFTKSTKQGAISRHMVRAGGRKSWIFIGIFAWWQGDQYLVLATRGNTQYVVFAHWMLCCPVGYVDRRGPYLPWQA